MKFIFLIIQLFFSFGLLSQSFCGPLISNGSFENVRKGSGWPRILEPGDNFNGGWYIINKTIDIHKKYKNIKPLKGWEDEDFIFATSPVSGKNFLGLYGRQTYNEMIGVVLNEKIERGKQYKISVFLKTKTPNKIEFYGSDKEPKHIGNSTQGMELIRSFSFDNSDWKKYEFRFTANKDYRQLIIRNPNSQLQLENATYILMDDIDLSCDPFGFLFNETIVKKIIIKRENDKILIGKNRPDGTSILLKFNSTGGNSSNMFNIAKQNSSYVGNSGTSALEGTQIFKHHITDILSNDENTIISFLDGKILKVKGIGGSGSNMFAINENQNGFSSVQGYDYRIGDAKFSSYITQMFYFNHFLILGFANGKMLKVKGLGGSGNNMFAVNENQNGFSSVQGYDYRIGDAKFESAVTDILMVGYELILGFANGKMLKVKGLGGSGNNMFAVNENQNGFSSVQGYDYRIGDAKFESAVVKLVYSNRKMLISFANGKILKVKELGGSGNNMFAVNENQNGFSSVQGYDYRIGDARFSSLANEIIYKNSTLIIGFMNGKILKVKELGGSGSNMFAVNENQNGFSSVQGYDYRIGDAKFKTFVVSNIIFSDNETLIGLNSGKILKVKELGGSGNNMFAVNENQNGFSSVPNFNYYIGDAIIE